MPFRTLETIDGGLAFKVEGTGQPVLLLHGWTFDGTMWDPQIAALRGKYRLIVPDRRGHGRSHAVADLTKEVADIVAILDLLDERVVSVVGMSQGGRVGLRFACQYPERVRALVLLGSSADGIAPKDDPDVIPIAKYRALIGDGEVEAFRRDWLAHPLTQGGDASVAQHCRNMVAKYRAEDLAAADAQSGPEQAADYSNLTVPVLALTGSQDTANVRHIADRLAAIIPNAQRLEIDGAGHLANLTHPTEVNSAIAAFLKAVDEKSGSLQRG